MTHLLSLNLIPGLTGRINLQNVTALFYTWQSLHNHSIIFTLC